MSQTVAHFILNRLADWGVPRIYGYPGDGINGFLGALHEAGERVEFVRHGRRPRRARCARRRSAFFGASTPPGAARVGR